MIPNSFKHACALSSEATNNNHHTTSLLFIALTMNIEGIPHANEITEALQAIQTIHDAYGYTLPNANALRNTIAEDLEELVLKTYGQEALDLMQSSM